MDIRPWIEAPEAMAALWSSVEKYADHAGASARLAFDLCAALNNLDATLVQFNANNVADIEAVLRQVEGLRRMTTDEMLRAAFDRFMLKLRQGIG